jgi:hypothetical protein
MASSFFEERLLEFEDAYVYSSTAVVILATMVLGGGYYSYSLQNKRPWPCSGLDPSGGSLSSR